MDFAAFVRKWGRRVAYDIRGGDVSIILSDPLILPVEIGEEFARIGSFSLGAYAGPVFTDRVEVNEKSARYWVYNIDNIVDAREEFSDRPLVKFAWNPVTGEFVFAKYHQNHADSLVVGKSLFDDYIRGIILRPQRTIALRAFFPAWLQRMQFRIEPDEMEEIAYRAQVAAKRMLEEHGAMGWHFHLNASSVSLEEVTGIHHSRW